MVIFRVPADQTDALLPASLATEHTPGSVPLIAAGLTSFLGTTDRLFLGQRAARSRLSSTFTLPQTGRKL